MSQIKISWNIIKNAFGEKYIAKTTQGYFISREKVKKDDILDEITLKLGFVPNKEYNHRKYGKIKVLELISYDVNFKPIYKNNLMNFCSEHFTLPSLRK